ncbi:MAG: hypothetical protein ACHQTE_02640 [Candidatus Saccharimonadales bacterium]
MTKTSFKQRMIENEAVFRRYNESVQKGLDSLQRIAKEDGQERQVVQEDVPLHFYCECSDENCRKRIWLPPSRYNTIHKKRNRFIVLNGHEVTSIERVVEREAVFSIVEKSVQPSESVTTLQHTEVDNV